MTGQAGLILIVDDEAAVRLSVATVAEVMGYRTIEVGNASEALNLLERHRDIDLLLTDVRMPGAIDGANLADTVRSRWPSISIVVMSGYFDPETSRLPAGVGFIAKPYRLDELTAAIERQMPSNRHAGSGDEPG